MTAASRPLVVYDSQQTFFDVMRDKLHWGRWMGRGGT
jgi:hypothetical protein